MRFNAIFLILLMFLTGCDLFDSCETSCEDGVIHHCTRNGGLMGGSVDEWEEDCKKDNMFCLEKGNTAYCVFKSDRCDASTESFCIDEKASAYCIEKNGKFYAGQDDSCYSSSNETCVEFDNEARCVIPVEKCNTKAEKVCFENSRVNCFEKDGSYYIEKNDYYDDCDEGEECVELDNERTYCLTPTDFCFVSENSICINYRPAVCYEKDGRFFMSYVGYCYSDTICVELENRDSECLTMISDYCDPEAESMCYGDAIATCYENAGFYYVNILNYCQRNDDDNCIYDSETKSAHCMSDEE